MLFGIWKDSRKKFHWNVLLKFVLEKCLSAVFFFLLPSIAHNNNIIVHHHSEEIDNFGSNS